MTFSLQSISKLFDLLGDSTAHIDFSNNLIQRTSTSATLLEALLTELEKIKVMVLPDGTRIVTEQTKRQKEILKTLGLCA